MTLLAFTLAASAVVAPGRDHALIGGAIARRVEAEAPLFKDDADKRKTAALLVAVGFREGSLGTRVEGDFVNGKPTSFCTMQVNLSPGARTREGWTGAELRDDPDKCIAVGMRLLRDSMRWCPAHPVAIYAAGPAGCSSDRARRISRDRMALAARIVRDAVVPVAGTESVKPAHTGFCTPIDAARRRVTAVRADASPGRRVA